MGGRTTPKATGGVVLDRGGCGHLLFNGVWLATYQFITIFFFFLFFFFGFFS